MKMLKISYLRIAVVVFLCMMFSQAYSQEYDKASNKFAMSAKCVGITGEARNNSETDFLIFIDNIGFSDWKLTLLDDDNKIIDVINFKPISYSKHAPFYSQGRSMIHNGDATVMIYIEKDFFQLYIENQDDSKIIEMKEDNNDKESLSILFAENGQGDFINNSSAIKIGTLKQLDELLKRYFKNL